MLGFLAEAASLLHHEQHVAIMLDGLKLPDKKLTDIQASLGNQQPWVLKQSQPLLTIKQGLPFSPKL